MSKILSGTAYWASVINPNTRFDDDGVWTIDVGNLDDLNKRMPVESAATQGDDTESFEKYLEEKISALANIVKDRDFEEQDHGS